MKRDFRLWSYFPVPDSVRMKAVLASCALLFAAEMPSPLLAGAATSPITANVVLAQQGGRVAWDRGNHALVVDLEGSDGYRDVWRYTVDSSGNATSRTCLTCNRDDMPFHNGNPRMDPFGRGVMFQVENKTCDAAAIGNQGSPGSGVCNDWWWADANGELHPVSAPLPNYDGRFAQMHGRWSKNADYFMFAYRLPGQCRDVWGCNIGGAWELHAVEIKWLTLSPNVSVPQFGAVHVYSPGKYPNHFYQMTGTSPADNGVVLFESNSLTPVTSLGDIDVATMRVRDSDGNWLSNEEAGRTVTVISEFSGDGAHTAEWNELADFTPDGTEIQWISNHGYLPATGLGDLYSDYWRASPDGSNKRQLSFFNTPGYPEYTGQRTIASNYTFQSVFDFYAYVFRAGLRPDNIYRIRQAAIPSLVVTNAATFLSSPGVAPGGLGTAFVTGLSGFRSSVAQGIPWQTELAGVQLAVEGTAAPLYYVGPAVAGVPGQINFQVPAATRPGRSEITVTVNGIQAGRGSATIIAASPGVFVSDAGSLQGAVLNQDNAINGASAPARRGEVVQIFGTGAGSLIAPVADGSAASPYSTSASVPDVYFGDTKAVVQFSGVTGYPGVWQVNAYVPASPSISGLVAIEVVQSGIRSNTVSVWVAR